MTDRGAASPTTTRPGDHEPRPAGLELWIPGKPTPWARTATVPNKNAPPCPTCGLRPTTRVNPREYRNWKQAAAQIMRLQRGRWRVTNPCGQDITVHPDGILVVYRDPETERPKGIRGDLDNYGKAVADAAEAAGALENDRLVVNSTIRFDPKDLAR